MEKSIDEVWEIGPGLGALTGALLEKSPCPVRIFEVDKKLQQHLSKEFPKAILVAGDFLETVKPPQGKIAVISNLPYHISSPILFQLLEFYPSVTRMVLMFQREFAERLRAKPRTKAYGSLSVLMQLHYQIESLGVIPSGAFFPKPEIDSESLLFVPKNTEGLGTEVAKIIRQAFSQRRKMLVNNLFGHNILPILEQLQISPKVRPEELTPEQFLAMSRLL